MKQLYKSSDAERQMTEDNRYPHRSEWRRDYTRLLHSPAFRKLQRKTQLFPNDDNDFFRNRLTHSLEVAQIGNSIVQRINHEYLSKTYTGSKIKKEDYYISAELVEFAALAHDIGHPPFGHNGEKALDLHMAEYGGFEGNAQSLRIVSRMIKRRFSNDVDSPFGPCGTDYRLGINPTYRSLAAILKYDNLIISRDKGSKLQKGYYSQESRLVENVKEKVVGISFSDDFKTIECQIMDLADDIAYSSYDLEDALHAEFISPLSILKKSLDKRFLEEFSKELLSRKSKLYGVDFDKKTPEELQETLEDKIYDVSDALYWLYTCLTRRDVNLPVMEDEVELNENNFFAALDFSFDGYSRSNSISLIVAYFIDNVEFDYNPDYPCMSTVSLTKEAKTRVETLKALTTYDQIKSSKLKSLEFMGKKVVSEIFTALDDDKEHSLLPSDWRPFLNNVNDIVMRKRLICDFVSQMSDRYACEFHDRLFSTSQSSIFAKF